MLITSYLIILTDKSLIEIIKLVLNDINQIYFDKALLSYGVSKNKKGYKNEKDADFICFFFIIYFV